MEAGSSRPAGGERSGRREQHSVSAETPLGPGPPQPSQQPSTTHPAPRALGRLQNRPPQRSNLLLRLQQQQAIAWQHSDTAGPSGGSFLSTAASSTVTLASASTSSARGEQAQRVLPQPSLDAPESGGPSKRGEKKPQKPGKYVCTYCGRPCAKPSVLQKHIRSHTGERPYPCAPCGFSFKTKSNLYKHRKSHAHRIKAGLASIRDEPSLSGPEAGGPGDDPEEPTEGESTESEEETGQHKRSSSKETAAQQKRGVKEMPEAPDEGQRPEDSQVVKQRLAMRLSERKRGPKASSDDPPSSLSTSSSSSSSLGPGSKGSTESGYFSGSGSTEMSQVSPPSASAKSYAEIILGKYGRMGGQQRNPHQQHPQSSSGPEEKNLPFTVPKTQVIEHITKLITINEAVVDTSEIDSVKPRRSSLSRKSSMESPKFSSAKDPHTSDPSKGEVPGPSYMGRIHGPEQDPARTQDQSSVPLLRSHSMPSSACKREPSSAKTASPGGFRLSHSFDEQQAAVAEMRVGHAQRMLRRQPAIEVPLGAEVFTEGGGPTSSDPARQQQQHQGPVSFECEACGARCKKRESYEAHRDVCPTKQTVGTGAREACGTRREDRPQIMHYKFRALAMAVRKRRKEESLEEDPPNPGLAPAPSTSTAYPSTYPPTFYLSSPSTSTASTPGPSRPEHTHAVSGTQQQDREGVSVIQHTSSFEKQESQEPAQPEPNPPPSSSSRLIRQPNIQVPEILVTVEPDADMLPVSPSATLSSSKEAERVEEFQWPQRSKTLSQLPAEKLPPKKKRLRLTEMTQSSGESSFESPSLPRSPGQESNVSHASSLSVSCEEPGRSEPALWVSSSQGSQMLTVPSASHQYQEANREMRRSASEQTPASPASSDPNPETRSKSFDLGSLSPQQSTSAWRERRKCLLVKHAALGEPEQEEGSAMAQLSRTESPKPGPSRSSYSPVYSTEVGPMLSVESIGKTLQLFHPQTLTHAAFPSQDLFPSGSQARLVPEPTAIRDGSSTQIIPRAYLHSQTAPPPIQIHMAERLGIPFHGFPGLLPLQFSTRPGAAPALSLSVPPLLTIHTPSPSSTGPPISAPPALPHPPFVPVPSRHARPVIVTCLAQLTPAVSLVVPVRLQTRMPSCACAMYTTLSQILASAHPQRPVCCTAVVTMGRLEWDKPQRSYLKVPSLDIESLMPLSLPVELASGSGAGESYCPLGAGGSKRMLSPAASLELSTEAQRHQKRVKEEEEVKEKKGVEEEEREVEDTVGHEVKHSIASRSKVEDVEERVKVEGEKQQPPRAPSQEGWPSGEEGSAAKQGRNAATPRQQSPARPGETPPYPDLSSSTAVNWCFLNYTKPSPSSHRDVGTSVYSSWSVSDHNPNLPGLSTKVSLSLLCSKQKHSSATYTVAILPSSNNQTPHLAEVHAAPPRAPPKPEKEEKREKKEEKREKKEEKREKKKGRREEDGASSSKRSESPRVRIFEGGYKSNEEYLYVRGRGRGRYVCGECGIRCKKPSMLRKHVRTHTDVRPYGCQLCSFAFKTKGNLTKHRKSKAHRKKCQAVGVSESSLDDPESEEAGGSEEHGCRSEEQQEHRFSDAEDFDEDEDEDDDDDEEDDEEEDDEEEESSSCSSDTRASPGGRSGRGRPSQRGTPDPEVSGGSPGPEPSARRPWSGGRAASPGSRRAVFSRRGWSASPRAFSPSGEDCSPGRSLSPRVEPSSPTRPLSPGTDPSSPGRRLSPSPERGPSPVGTLSPLRPLASSCYRASRAPSPALRTQYRPPAYLPWESPGLDVPPERSGTSGEVPMSPEATPFPPAFRLSFSEGYPGSPAADRVFSHLPLHSRQAKVPYPMIPIGGIQMVQARHRPRPTTTPPVPTSPPTEGPSPARCERWGGASGTPVLRTPGGRRSGYQEAGTARSGSSNPRAALDCSVTETTDSKQYGSSHSSAHSSAATETRDLHARPSHGQAIGPPREGPEGPEPGPGEGPVGTGAEGDTSRRDKRTY